MILLEMGGMPTRQTLDIGCRIRTEAKAGDEVKVVVYADQADEIVSDGAEVRLGPHEYVILPEDGEQFEGFLCRLLTE
jgi:hypothetical protein